MQSESRVSTRFSTTCTLPVPTAISLAGGLSPEPVAVAPVATSMLNSATGVAPAHSQMVTLRQPFDSRLPRSIPGFPLGFDGQHPTGSPTQRDRKVLKKPMLAPTSRTWSPSRIAARMPGPSTARTVPALNKIFVWFYFSALRSHPISQSVCFRKRSLISQCFLFLCHSFVTFSFLFFREVGFKRTKKKRDAKKEQFVTF